jgi:DNA primase catalytic core
MNLTNELEVLKSQLRPYLVNFLLEHGIEIGHNNMLCCIEPMHNDESPSMKILQDHNSEAFYCYGCGAFGDIFTAHEWLDNAPGTGIQFIKENLYALADKYKISYNEIELTEEQIEIFSRIKVNKAACSLMSVVDKKGNPKNWTDSHAIARGWKSEACKALGIRTVLDYNSFLRDLSLATSIDPKELADHYDIRSDMFGPDYITIPIFDVQGQPAGFTARWMKWKKGSKQSKYSNSHNSVAFQKSNILYGMHLSKKSTGRRLDVFEGNGSYITAMGHGHRSSVAIMGTALSEAHVRTMQALGFSHINLVLDSDITGRKKTSKLMEMLSGREGLKVTHTKIPENHDPDSFIMSHGLNEFYKLGTVSAFEFMLEEHINEIETGNVDKFISRMMKIIQNTANRIERGQQIKALSAIANIPEEDIRDEMSRIERVSVDNIKGSLASGIRHAKDTDELLAIMEKTRVSVEETSGLKNERLNLSDQESLENFQDLASTLRNKKPGIQGWKTGFSLLDHRLSGIKKPVGIDDAGNQIPMPGLLMAFGGASQHGKSTVLLNITMNIAMLNDDVSVLYWGLDDPRELISERMIAMVSGVAWEAVTQRRERTKEEEEKIQEAIQKISKLIAEGRFILKDQSNGRSLPMLRRWVEHSYKEHNRPICVVIDSFHKISTTQDQATFAEAAKAKAHSEELKSFYKTHNLTIIVSLEVNKAATPGIEPGMINITETRKVEYDFDVIGMVFNHFFDTDGDSDQIITEGNKVKPVIKVNIRKSKVGGAGPLYFALDPETFRLKSYSLEDIKRITATEEITSTNVSGGRIVPPDKGGFKSVSRQTSEPWN